VFESRSEAKVEFNIFR